MTPSQDPASPPPAGGELSFFERSGPEARQAMEALAAELRAEGSTVGLWRSLDQAEPVWMLIAHGRTAARALPAGTRHWRFEAVP